MPQSVYHIQLEEIQAEIDMLNEACTRPEEDEFQIRRWRDRIFDLEQEQILIEQRQAELDQMDQDYIEFV
jgi:uncharacterized protein (DUF3084 family)